MSTILEALRKLEREHSQQSRSRSLRETVAGGAAAEDPPAPAAWRMPLAALVVGVGLGAGLLLWWGGSSDAPEPGAGQAVPARVQPQAPLVRFEAIPPEPSGAPVVETIALPRPEPDVAVLDRPPAPPRNPIAWSSGKTRGSQPAAPEPSEARAPSPGPAPVAPPSPAALAPPAPAPSRTASVPVVPEPVAAAVPPKRVRATPLSLRVERTFWHPKAERRVAIVRLPGSGESRPVQEGEQLGGFTVQRIEPSRVIFEREGIEVARPLEAR